ncbi:MAG: ABC transporter ATP-binding protein [Candidatus Asgardarchaeia archaeon]
MSEQELVIETIGLTKFFGSKNIVYNLNLKVPANSIFGFLGPNGAGKSTTIKLILGLLKPTFGKIKIFGKDSIEKHKEIMMRIGYQPEKPIAYENMTAFNFLKHMGRLYGLTSKEAATKAKENLDFVGLGKMAFTTIKNFSAGQKQRLSLANALINDPDLLILDEPTSNLDPLGRIEIMDKIKELVRKRNVTVFISSHILPEIERVCDHVAIINNGQLIIQGKIADLVKDVKDTVYVVSVTEPEKLKEGIEELSYVKEVIIRDTSVYILVDIADADKLWNDVPRIISSLGIKLKEFRPLRSPLEKSFIDALGVGGFGEEEIIL